MLKIEGYKEKSVNNLFDAIEKARNTTLDRAFVALGIPNVGKKTAKQIVTLFDDIFDQNRLLQKIFEITEENLLNLVDIGPETARAFVNFMSDNRQMVEKFF
jgi:DNA ligase